MHQENLFKCNFYMVYIHVHRPMKSTYRYLPYAHSLSFIFKFYIKIRLKVHDVWKNDSNKLKV